MTYTIPGLATRAGRLNWLLLAGSGGEMHEMVHLKADGLRLAGGSAQPAGEQDQRPTKRESSRCKCRRRAFCEGLLTTKRR